MRVLHGRLGGGELLNKTAAFASQLKLFFTISFAIFVDLQETIFLRLRKTFHQFAM
jgi:hypothetical protein